MTTVSCAPVAGYVLDHTDCDDTKAGVNPAASEICGNSIDDNCNGKTDEGCAVSCVATVVNGLDKTADFVNNSTDWMFDAKGSFTATYGTVHQYLRWGYSAGCGYYGFPNEKATVPLTVAANANFVAIDVAFSNTLNSSGGADPKLYMTLNFDGVTQQIGPFSTLHAASWFTVIWPVSASQQGLAKSIVATVQSTNDSTSSCGTAYYGGIGLDNVRVISGCTDTSNFCAPASSGGLQGFQTWYRDADGDGYGIASTTTTGCGQPAGYAAVSGDCDDTNAAVHPGAAEICDGLDNDCNGATDDLTGSVLNSLESSSDTNNWLSVADWWFLSSPKTEGSYSAWWGDSGGCGYGKLANDSLNFNITVPTGASGVSIDVFFDNRHSVLPDTVDTTAKMVLTLNGVTRQVGPFATIQNPKWRTLVWPMAPADAGKTYTMSAAMTTTLANTSNGNGCSSGSAGGFAIDDVRAVVACNGSSSACTPGVPASNWYKDGDGDGYGDTASAVSNCIQPTGYIAAGGDCNDANAAVNPGVAKDTCATVGVDDNCDGVTDGVSSTGCTNRYTDADGDTYGAGAATCVCSGSTGVTVNGDCNDGDASIHPGATEVCNGVDDDCNGVTDPQNSVGCNNYALDADTDGYGVAGSTQCWCSAHLTYSALVTGDCNDAVKAINPGASEVCNNIDDNCNGATDEGLPQGTWFRDADGDGYKNPDPALAITGCDLAGYVTSTAPDDCLDSNATVHAGAPEICYDGLDNNCDGVTDEGCAACSASLLNGFESKLNVTWTGSQWGVLATPHTEGTNALGWSSLFNGGGNGYYSTSGSGEYMYVSATIPTGTAFVKADIYVGNRSLSAVDTNMVVTPTLGGALPLGGALGPYSTYQGSNSLKTVVWAVTPSQWNTQVQFKVNVATNVTSADPLGYVMVDNLRTTCN